MATQIDISLLVSMSAVLTMISLVLVGYLLRTASGRFRGAVYWYAGSTVSLMIAVLGVMTLEHLPFALNAVLIIAGAHCGIVFAYAAFRHASYARLHWLWVILVPALTSLAQGALALFYQDISMLMVTSSVVNGLFGLFAAADISRLTRQTDRWGALLLSLPFAFIGLTYLGRMLLVLQPTGNAPLLTSTAAIAFVLGVSSAYWGFALIVQREAILNIQLKDARLKAESTARQRAQFFAQMNHEIRTPLNGILGVTELLKPHVNKPEAVALLNELQNSGNLLLSIVNEVLDFSKVEAGQVRLEILSLDLKSLLESAAAHYRRVAASKNVALTLYVEPDPMPPVMGDPMRLNQILHNILSNALKFTRAGEIGVRMVRQPDGTINIQVADTGIGMTQEQLASFFVPFQQASADTARRFGGTGLGMSIVKMLVDTMGGQIRVDSQPGRGTTISVNLPLPEAPVTLNAEDGQVLAPEQAAWQGRCGSLAILCADDDPINRMVLQAMLESYGVQPVMAEDGHEAVRLAGLQRFDAYLIDISMPGMDGIETLSTLREGDRNGHGPTPLAIATTANVLRDDVDAYLSSGFDAHLPKPILRDDIETVLKSILSRTGQNV
jgi:signal transduction histidine kinase/CheY-like chemotaxis protein